MDKVTMITKFDYRELAPKAIYLDDLAFERFLAVLDNPPPPSAKLRQLFREDAA